MKIAKNVAAQTGFDITIILAIITAAIQLWEQCHDRKDLPGTLLNRLYRRRLAKILRQHDAPPGMLDTLVTELKNSKAEDFE